MKLQDAKVSIPYTSWLPKRSVKRRSFYQNYKSEVCGEETQNFTFGMLSKYIAGLKNIYATFNFFFFKYIKKNGKSVGFSLTIKEGLVWKKVGED